MKPRIAVFLQPQHAEYDQIRAAAIESEKIGADVMTGPLSAIKGLLNHPLTDIGLAKFLADHKKGN